MMMRQTLLRTLLGLRMTAYLVRRELLSIRHIQNDFNVRSSQSEQRAVVLALRREHLTSTEIVLQVLGMLQSSYRSVQTATIDLLLRTYEGGMISFGKIVQLVEQERKCGESSFLFDALRKCLKKKFYYGASYFRLFVYRRSKKSEIGDESLNALLDLGDLRYARWGKAPATAYTAKQDLIDWVDILVEGQDPVSKRDLTPEEFFRVRYLISCLIEIVLRQNNNKAAVGRVRDLLLLIFLQDAEGFSQRAKTDCLAALLNRL